jgi:hypothetical protein
MDAAPDPSTVDATGFRAGWWNLPISERERALYDGGHATVEDVRSIVRAEALRPAPPPEPEPEPEIEEEEDTTTAPDDDVPAVYLNAVVVPDPEAPRLAWTTALRQHRAAIEFAMQENRPAIAAKLRTQLTEIETHVASILTHEKEMARVQRRLWFAKKQGNAAKIAPDEARIEELLQERAEFRAAQHVIEKKEYGE